MTTKTLKRVRFNRADYAIEPETKTLKSIQPEDRTYKYVTYRRTALNIYSGLYYERYHSSPFRSFIVAQLTFSKPGAKTNDKCKKYIKMFNDISDFLLDLKEEHNSVNPIEDLLRDYFTCILNHYGQYNRIPNINQLGPGPVNTQNFFQYATQEEHFGFGYWLEEKHMFLANDIRANPEKYQRDDPFMDLCRMRAGLPPLWRKYRTLSEEGDAGEIVEDGVVKIYSPIGKMALEQWKKASLGSNLSTSF